LKVEREGDRQIGFSLTSMTVSEPYRKAGSSAAVKVAHWVASTAVHWAVSRVDMSVAHLVVAWAVR